MAAATTKTRSSAKKSGATARRPVTKANAKEVYDVPKMIQQIHAYIDSHCGLKPLLADDGTQITDAKGKPVYEWQVPQQYECFKQYGWRKQTVYDLRDKSPDLAEALEALGDAKKYRVERGGLVGQVKETFAIFILKQLGYTDNDTVNIVLSKDLNDYSA